MVKMGGVSWLACIYRWPGYGSGWRWHSPQLLRDIRINIAARFVQQLAIVLEEDGIS